MLVTHYKSYSSSSSSGSGEEFSSSHNLNGENIDNTNTNNNNNPRGPEEDMLHLGFSHMRLRDDESVAVQMEDKYREVSDQEEEEISYNSPGMDQVDQVGSKNFAANYLVQKNLECTEFASTHSATKEKKN